MSDKKRLTLNDLRAKQQHEAAFTNGYVWLFDKKVTKADLIEILSTTDLVEALKARGAVTIWWCEQHETHGGSRQFKAAHQFCEPAGPHLVFSLEGEK